MHILVAEDNPTNARVLEQMLSHLGHSSHWVTDGQAVLDLIEETDRRSFDLILMDLHMPRMNGFDATEELLRRSSEAPPIVACSASAYEADIAKAKASGMAGFLSKPIRVDTLEATLAEPFALSQQKADGDSIDWPQVELLFADRDPELIEVFRDFCDQAETSLAELRNLMEQDKISAACEKAHQLRGSFLTFGLSRMSQTMAEIEHTATPDDILSIKNGWEGIQDSLGEDLLAIKKFLED